MAQQLTPFQREVAAAFRAGTPLAQRARVIQTLRSNAQTNPVALAKALELPSSSSSSTLNSISQGITAASLALAPAEIAAELALGTNPFTAIPFIAFDIASLTGLLPSFSGKPKLVDSVQAIQRLAQSSNPAVQQLAANLAIYARNGVPLSTSNPAQQAQIRDWIAGTIQTILQQRGLPLSSSNVSSLDQSIRNVLTSEIANPGSRIDATVAQLGGLPAPAPAPAPAPKPFAVTPIRSANPGRTIPQPNPPASSSSSSSSLPVQVLQWLASSGLLGGLGTLAAQDAEQLGHCIFDFIRGGTTHALLCLGDLLARQTEKAAKDFLSSIRDLFRSQPSPSSSQPSSQQGTQPTQPAPILDQKSDCPGCTPAGRQRLRQLQKQESRTLRDIEREQAQLTEQEISTQAQQLSQLEELETQPQTSSQISQSLQQKQQLLEQIRSEEQTAGGQPSSPSSSSSSSQPSQPAPQLQSSSSQAAQQEITQELEAQQASNPVQFCVGCQSQEDAILFLNGEPSKCSVIPGSTKEVSYGT